MDRRGFLMACAAAGLLPAETFASEQATKSRASGTPLCISGVYPGLTAYNGTGPESRHGEAGIGAIVPWAGRLWFLTYPPHMTQGSDDKLYSIDDRMELTVHPESVGGTHANRMIHRETNQLIIGPYLIDDRGKIRVLDIKKQIPGRLTAAMRHLTDPANKIYIVAMEGALFEVDVHTLEARQLFAKPVPGWHGKGGYTAQGRIVVSNNGNTPGSSIATLDSHVVLPPASPEDTGVLAEWDGTTWQIVERRAFTEVTGPGGLRGSPDAQTPLWAMGWDKRSVLLELLDGGQWSRFRVAKGSHAYDPKHGWYTEWPRIREVTGGLWLMVMHGQMFQFPPTFAAANTAGIRPICTQLRYIPDVCGWGDRLVLATDETTVMQNPLAGQAQSNLWFGTWDDLATFGPRTGWGGVWVGDAVKAGAASDPFLVAGYDSRILHLAHTADHPVDFRLEVDKTGHGSWEAVHTMTVPPRGYDWFLLPPDLKAEWARLIPGADTAVSGYFHLTSPRKITRDEAAIFDGFGPRSAHRQPALIRPSSLSRNLQVLVPARDGKPEQYYEVDERLKFTLGVPAADVAAIRPKWEISPDITVDKASLLLTDPQGKRWRLPRFDEEWDAKTQRGRREIESERSAANWGGLFYEVSRGELEKGGVDYQTLRPVAAHKLPIADYCTWRGLLVLSGVRAGAKPDGHTFRSDDGEIALWFGAVDDLWKLGKPQGHGGPWLDTPVKAGEPSDPYLMTNFDRKRLTLRHAELRAVDIAIEVDFTNTGYYHRYKTVSVPSGAEGVIYDFPEGYSAHWVRLISPTDTTATAQFEYS